MIKRVLLTGAAGYLGGRIAPVLQDAGHEVVNASRHADASSGSALRTVRVDWDDEATLQAACTGVDSVIHLAAMNEVDAAQDPLGALRMNGMASLALLQAARRCGVRRFIYFSTAHVYGAPLAGHITEARLPRPQHPYAITHKVTEDFVLAAHDQRQLEGVVVRLSNGFGAPASPDIKRWTLLVNDLCRQAASSGKLTLNSPGLQLRDFITLSDVSRATQHLLELPAASLQDGLFNLGSGTATSIFDITTRVASRFRTLTGRSIEIVRPDPSQAPAPAPLHYDCSKLLSTGFTLNNPVDEEIDATLRLCLGAFGGKA